MSSHDMCAHIYTTTFSFVVAFLYQQNLNHTICRRTNLNSLGCFYSKKKLTWQSCSWTFLYYIKDHHIIQIFDRKDLAQQQRVSWNFIYMTLYLYYYIYLWSGSRFLVSWGTIFGWNSLNLNPKEQPGPIAEQSNLLDRGRGDPSLNPGEGCYGEFELS